MKKYNNILLPLDVTHLFDNLGERAVELAEHYQARLTLLFVLEHYAEDESFTTDKGSKSTLLTRASGLLLKFAKQAGCEDAERIAIPSEHSVRHEILKFAQERQIDLIIVGSHAPHGVEYLLGTTAMGLVHGAKCDVLTIRMPAS